MKWKVVVAALLAGIGGIDLLTGNTNKQILPAFLGNVLTQQVDLLLLAIAAFIYWGL